MDGSRRHGVPRHRSPRSGVGLLTALLVLVAVTLAGPAAAASPVTVRYSASTAVLADPERGFFHSTTTNWSPDGTAYTPLDAAQMQAWRTGEGITLVYRNFYLRGLADQDAIDQRFLDQVAADLAAARTAGVKLVIRFAYSPDNGHDAPPARAVAQIGQLAGVVNAAADVVLVVQAGFIGQWGEWYYSDSYTTDPATPWTVTAADWRRRGQVLDALLADLSPSIRLQVRTPAIRKALLRDTDPRAARVGVHDDCFLASADDYGTFQAGDQTWLASRSASVPVGGETCAVNAPRSSWTSAAKDLARYHWSFLNRDYNTDVLASWGTTGLTQAARSLGYRLRLVSSSAPTTARRGTVATVGLTLTNDGYAAPLSGRPVQLVLQQGTAQQVVAVPLDVRSLAPGASRTVTVSVPVPPALGAWSMSLALPDAAPSLAGNPAYAVQLADTGVWDPVTGRNSLLRTLVVS